MKFLVDAQLPVRLSHLLKSMGHDAIHTKELALKNAKPDTEINTLSICEQRIVIPKIPIFGILFVLIKNLTNFC